MDARPDHLLKSARERFDAGDPYGAIHLLTELIASGQAFADAHNLYGLCHAVVGKQEEALAGLASRPDIAARNANYVGSTAANIAALPLVEPALRTDPMLYPDAAMRARLVPLHARTLAQSRVEGQLWTRFVTMRD